MTLSCTRAAFAFAFVSSSSNAAKKDPPLGVRYRDAGNVFPDGEAPAGRICADVDLELKRPRIFVTL
jgi:hypothetical protein